MSGERATDPDVPLYMTIPEFKPKLWESRAVGIHRTYVQNVAFAQADLEILKRDLEDMPLDGSEHDMQIREALEAVYTSSRRVLELSRAIIADGATADKKRRNEELVAYYSVEKAWDELGELEGHDVCRARQERIEELSYVRVFGDKAEQYKKTGYVAPPRQRRKIWRKKNKMATPSERL